MTMPLKNRIKRHEAILFLLVLLLINLVLFSAHMWFDNVTIEADTTEDQSGVSHNKVSWEDVKFSLP